MRTIFNTYPWLTAAAGTIGLLIVPFLFVVIPPSTDLPEHLTQIHLLNRILDQTAPADFEVRWLGFNTLVYYVLWLNCLIFTPILAGKMMLVELAACWAGSIFLLARALNRPILNAIIACFFVLNSSFYWGFLPFLSGFPVFVGFLIFFRKQTSTPTSMKSLFFSLLFSLLLYLAHVLWLAAAMIILLSLFLLQRVPLASIAIRFLAFIPAIAVSLFALHGLSSSLTAVHLDNTTQWQSMPWERLAPGFLIESLIGGIRGPFEALVIIFVLLWALNAYRSNKSDFGAKTDKSLLTCSVVLFALFFGLPEKTLSTIVFATRWAPIAAVFLVLALPSPATSPLRLKRTALGVLVAYIAAVSFSWYQFEKQENSGLRESLAATGKGARILGLAMTRQSLYIQWFPFFHMPAYAQVLNDSPLHCAWVVNQTGFVSSRSTNVVNQTSNYLVLAPENVQPSHFMEFEYALIHGNEEIHQYAASRSFLVPVTTVGAWRLYRPVRLEKPSRD